ncbi:PfkB family carbohydrate kinase [Massilia endophytica]|uniref:PfkB family carbohydrate kinase n=1 Tax=Massilia endophytica TaxID=2899220 RepID=UPI001E40041B|nr:PfkB family carbohydrate kinase [Massilia endophytica]UGQ45993.1 PfkB family carbohydrate kinase [Massilia endophytica]
MEHAVLVFGEALVDESGSRPAVGGAPFNLARHLSALGVRSTMVTRVGSDANGALVQAEFERFGMSQAGLQRDDAHRTGRVIAAGDLDFPPEQAYDHIAAGPALAALQSTRPDIICFGTLAQRSPTSRETLHTLLGASQAMRFLDLNLRDGQVDESIVFDSLQQADILKVNEEELQVLFGWYCHTCPETANMDHAAVESECRAMMHNFSLSGLIVTQGERGATWYSADGVRMSQHDVSQAGQFADTVGAGDAFDAVFLLGRLKGWSIEQTLSRANAFASACCGVAGAVPQLPDYAPWLERWAR